MRPLCRRGSPRRPRHQERAGSPFRHDALCLRAWPAPMARSGSTQPRLARGFLFIEPPRRGPCLPFLRGSGPKDYVSTVGRMAYLWGWPLVNQINRRASFAQAPEPGRLGGVVPVTPEDKAATRAMLEAWRADYNNAGWAMSCSAHRSAVTELIAPPCARAFLGIVRQRLAMQWLQKSRYLIADDSSGGFHGHARVFTLPEIGIATNSAVKTTTIRPIELDRPRFAARPPRLAPALFSTILARREHLLACGRCKATGTHAGCVSLGWGCAGPSEKRMVASVARRSSTVGAVPEASCALPPS